MDGSLGDDHFSPWQTKDGQTEASGGNSKLGGCDNGTLAQTTHQVVLDEPCFLIWKLHLAILPVAWAACSTAVCLVVLTWPHLGMYLVIFLCGTKCQHTNQLTIYVFAFCLPHQFIGSLMAGTLFYCCTQTPCTVPGAWPACGIYCLTDCGFPLYKPTVIYFPPCARALY